MGPKEKSERLERVALAAAEHAASVDAEASFPSATVHALRENGFLGLVSAPAVGGGGASFAGAVEAVERVGRECGSSAMVLCMHYCGTAVLEAHASRDVRQAAASGTHLSTLAFSEAGSRSHFWAPVSDKLPSPSAEPEC